MTKPSASRWSISDDGSQELRKDGEPVLLLGGQVHNSSSSSPRSIRESFAHVRRMNGNAVLAPVSWALLEPEEGRFDFTLVDAMLDEARRGGLRLVLLWFGAFKNAASTYAPRWVRADRARFPRAVLQPKGPELFTYEGAMPKPVLSVFSAALRDADALAFEQLMSHLADVDRDGVVAMVQVENESGLLGDSRDRGPLADQAWNAPVPAGLLDSLSSGADAGASAARTLWQEQGARTSGTWGEVFGTDWRAEEVFMAWGFADYAEHLAARGAAIHPVPLYANAWLGPQPGADIAGQYPSGGPGSRVLDVWRAAAPTLALLGPDIYVDDADPVMRTYAAGEQPLFIPECRPRAGELIRAVGAYRAIGWSAFGVDDGNPDGQVAAVLAFLTALEQPLLRARRDGRLAALVLEPGAEKGETSFGELEIVGRGSLELLRRMLLDAGVEVPTTQVAVPDATSEHASVPHPGETRPFALLFSEEPDVIVLVGQGVTVDLAAAGSRIEVDSVEELLVEDGRIVEGRVLNGDERLQILPPGRVGAARIRLLRG